MTEKEYYDQVDAEYSYVNELLNQLDSAYGDGYADGYKYAVDEFAKRLKTDYVNFELYYIFQDNEFADDNTSIKYYQKMIDEIAEELKSARGSE